MSEAPERTALYRIWGEAGLLLYIGVSKDFGTRWKREAKEFAWWPEMRRLTADEWFDSRKDAEDAEAAAIKAEQPKYNKRHRVPAARRPRSPVRPAPDAVASARNPVPGALVTPARERAGEGSVPYPYSLLSVRLPEPDLSDADTSTPEGILQVAAALNAYELKARTWRSSLEKHIAAFRELERDPDMTWARAAVRRMRTDLEELIGDGTHLATGREAQERAARILREDAALGRKLGDAMGAIIDALETAEAPGLSADRPAA